MSFAERCDAMRCIVTMLPHFAFDKSFCGVMQSARFFVSPYPSPPTAARKPLNV